MRAATRRLSQTCSRSSTLSDASFSLNALDMSDTAGYTQSPVDLEHEERKEALQEQILRFRNLEFKQKVQHTN